VRARLLSWWDAGHRDLPWRYPQHAADPYRVWVAEVMLQQTRVAVVVPYYRRFVRRFPTLRSLARAGDEEVLALWSGLGYYARARRLLAAARDALARHGGLPASVDELRRLPGFGRYTAGAVASIAFAAPVPCVDGNAERVLGRLFHAARARREAARDRAWALASELVPRGRPGDFNQALMELGATVCVPRAPRCGECPFAGVCAARRRPAGRAEPPRVARRRPGLTHACAVLRDGEALLLRRRPPHGLFAGLWELPSAEVVPPIDPRTALRRELREQLGRGVTVGARLGSVRRELSHRVLRLDAYACTAPPGLLEAVGGPFRLASGTDLSRLGLATAMRKLLETVGVAAPSLDGGRARSGARPGPRAARRP
jgi:A/G-specific adenine glycosylase